MIEKTIKLSTGLYDSKVCTYADNDTLNIKMVGTTFANLKYYFNYEINGKTGNLLMIDNSITLMLKDLNFGILKAKIVAMGENKVAHTYQCENLIIEQLDGTMRLIPEMVQLKNQVANEMRVIKDRQNELSEQIAVVENLRNEVNILRQMVYALCEIEGGNE